MANPFDIIFQPVIKSKSVIVAGTELYAGLTPLDKRKSLTVFNTSEEIIQLSTDAAFVYGDGIPIYPGQYIILTLNPDRYDAWYAKTQVNPATITIVEVR